LTDLNVTPDRCIATKQTGESLTVFYLCMQESERGWFQFVRLFFARSPSYKGHPGELGEYSKISEVKERLTPSDG
jgi:hypothetical protein